MDSLHETSPAVTCRCGAVHTADTALRVAWVNEDGMTLGDDELPAGVLVNCFAPAHALPQTLFIPLVAA